MAYAVQECYYSIEKILLSLVEGEGKLWFVFVQFYYLNLCLKIIMLQFTILFLSFFPYFHFNNILSYRVERIFREINDSIKENSLVMTLDLKKLNLVLSRFTALTGLLVIILTIEAGLHLLINLTFISNGHAGKAQET